MQLSGIAASIFRIASSESQERYRPVNCRGITRACGWQYVVINKRINWMDFPSVHSPTHPINAHCNFCGICCVLFTLAECANVIWRCGQKHMHCVTVLVRTQIAPLNWKAEQLICYAPSTSTHFCCLFCTICACILNRLIAPILIYNAMQFECRSRAFHITVITTTTIVWDKQWTAMQ